MGYIMKDPKIEQLIAKTKTLFTELENINRELIKHDVRYSAKISPDLVVTISDFTQVVRY